MNSEPAPVCTPRLHKPSGEFFDMLQQPLRLSGTRAAQP
ncbi:hypothetical protein APV28_2113 [Comamonas testosteroni]|nr:hypothetical protein APV28_2113 [Comamonas testosteroni]